MNTSFWCCLTYVALQTKGIISLVIMSRSLCIAFISLLLFKYIKCGWGTVVPDFNHILFCFPIRLSGVEDKNLALLFINLSSCYYQTTIQTLNCYLYGVCFFLTDVNINNFEQTIKSNIVFKFNTFPNLIVSWISWATCYMNQAHF